MIDIHPVPKTATRASAFAILTNHFLRWVLTQFVRRSVRNFKLGDVTRALEQNDIIFGYRLAHGRMPESDAIIKAKIENNPREFFYCCFNCDEFMSNVFAPVMSMNWPSEELFEGQVNPEFTDWARSRLPLAESTSEALSSCTTWPLALTLILSDVHFQSWLEPEANAWKQTGFLDRLRKWAFIRKRKIVGNLDFASAHHIRGWAMNSNDPAERLTLLVQANGILAATCETNIVRDDVENEHGGGPCGYEAALDLEGSGLAGDVAHLTVREQKSGIVLAEAHVPLNRQFYRDRVGEIRDELARVGRTLAEIERMLPDVRSSSSFSLGDYEHYQSVFYERASGPADGYRERLARLGWTPRITVVMPLYETDLVMLGEAVRSVIGQRYRHWELILSDDASSGHAGIAALVDRLRHELRPGQEIVLLRGEARQGISGATNDALARAGGDYVAFMDHEDTLTPDALLCMVEALQRQPRPRVLYSDEDRMWRDEAGVRHYGDPHFKPAFDPILLTQSNYICHLVMIERALCREVGALDPAYDGAQDYDFVLRAVEAAGDAAVAHVPRVLYHWRVTPGSLSRDPERTAVINRHICALVAAHLARRGQQAQVGDHAELLGGNRNLTVRLYPVALAGTRATVIIPTRDRLDLLRPCVESVLRSRKSGSVDIDLLIVDNGSTTSDCQSFMRDLSDRGNATVLRDASAFNWSALNNRAAEQATGDVLIFLNNDTVVLADDWCDELCFWALQPDVGAVGGRLLLANGHLQHAGTVLSKSRITMHEGHGAPADDPGYLGRHHVAHRVSAVTGACMATRSGVFRRFGGFDADRYPIICNDTDYCLRLREAGLGIVYTPHAVLYHFESVSRGVSTRGPVFQRSIDAFRERWEDCLDSDPFYNRHFEREAPPFTRLAPPARMPKGRMAPSRDEQA